MHSQPEDGTIPTAKGAEKKANLAKDEKIKSFWNNIGAKSEGKTIPKTTKLGQCGPGRVCTMVAGGVSR